MYVLVPASFAAFVSIRYQIVLRPIHHLISPLHSFYFGMNLVFLLILLCITSQTIFAIRRHPLDFFHDPSSKNADDYHETTSYNNENIAKAAEDLVESVIFTHGRREQSDSGDQELPTPFDHLVTSLPYLAEGVFSTPHYAGHIPGACEEQLILFSSS